MDRVLFVCYPGCSTCAKARKWLEGRGIAYTERNIAQDNPDASELAAWAGRSGLPLRRFFNTSGMKYRELGLKDKLDGMDEQAMLALLATDGMLVKRPLLVSEQGVLVGFREAQWAALLGGE